jgi:flagellin
MQVNNSQTNNTLNYINTHKKNTEDELNKISSGKKQEISDAAMMQIAQALMSDATVMSQGIQNANESVAMLQIADGALQSVSQGATRLEELNVRANSAALNSDQKRMLENQYNAQVKAMNDAMSQASYNGQPLFGKSFSTSLGDSEINFNIPELNTAELSLGNSDALSAFRESINSALSEVGSATNAFGSSINSLLETRTNTLAAYSQMADTDIAQSVSNFKNEELLTQTSLYAQAYQQNIDQNRVSALLA